MSLTKPSFELQTSNAEKMALRIECLDLSGDELAKLYVRQMDGGMPTRLANEPRSSDFFSSTSRNTPAAPASANSELPQYTRREMEYHIIPLPQRRRCDLRRAGWVRD